MGKTMDNSQLSLGIINAFRLFPGLLRSLSFTGFLQHGHLDQMLTLVDIMLPRSAGVTVRHNKFVDPRFWTLAVWLVKA